MRHLSCATLLLLLSFLNTTLSNPLTLNTTQPPIIAIIPDAWHIPAHYTLLTHSLSLHGYSSTLQRLPSTDSAHPRSESLATDALFIRENILLPQIDNGREVVLLMHSYGAVPGSMAAKGLSVRERRQKGLKGGVVGLICVCGILVREGVVLRSLLEGGRFENWIVEYPNAQLSLSNPTPIFYADVPAPIAALALHSLRNQSLFSFLTPATAPAWADLVFEGRRAYARTGLDRVITGKGQDWMVEGSGVRWEVGRLEAGHAPMLGCVGGLGVWVGGVIDNWRRDDSRI